MKKQSFVFGALILGLSGIVCKVLGAIYKIPLTNILGSQGMGIYYLVFPIYAFLISMTSSSFTLAISKNVSRLSSQKRFYEAYKIFIASLFLLLILGFFCCIGLLCLSKIIASLQGVENAYICYLIIAPALIFVSIGSAFKGYFQGLQNMIPTATSQVTNQIIKLSAGFLFANFFSLKGAVFGTFGALMGVSIAEIFTCLFFVIYFFVFKRKNKQYFKFNYKNKSKSTFLINNYNILKFKKIIDNKYHLKRFGLKKLKVENLYLKDKKLFIKEKKKIFLPVYIKTEEKKLSINIRKRARIDIIKKMRTIFKEAIPFTLSSIIIPMSLVIDSFLIINILKSMNFQKNFATSLLGINSGIINTLISLPSTLSIGICVSIVPFITFALSKKDYKGISEKTSFAIKLALFIAIPCVLIFCCFSYQILKLLYSSSLNSDYEISLVSNMLIVSSVNVLYLSILQITTSLLQAINRSYVPVISLSFSLIFKVILEIFLISIPSINIFGAIISNSVCYILSAGINIYYFRKEIDLNFSIYKMIICPFICSIIMIIAIFTSLNLLSGYLTYSINIILSFIMGFLIYLSLLFFLHGFSKQELNILFKYDKRTIN